MQGLIKIATPEDVDTVLFIVSETITQIYANYYPKEVVSFFLAHHCRENIIADITGGNVFLLSVDGICVCTGTLNEDYINRVFVLSAFQGKGLGKQMMNFLEEKVSVDYTAAFVHSSLPAFNMYIKRGYEPLEYHEEVVSDSGQVLFYSIMKKDLPTDFFSEINLNGRLFKNVENSESGEVSGLTIFRYFQNNDLIWAFYEGGIVRKGFLIGKYIGENFIEFSYQHINFDKDIRIGKCKSRIEKNETGKINLYEEWQWFDQEKMKGQSILEEIDSGFIH